MLNAMLAIFEGLTPMNRENLLSALDILWKGLLAIFIVIALIIVAVKFSAYCIAKCDELKQRAEQNAQNENENNNR